MPARVHYGLQWYIDFGVDMPGEGLAWVVHEGELSGPVPLPLFGATLVALPARARRSRR